MDFGWLRDSFIFIQSKFSGSWIFFSWFLVGKLLDFHHHHHNHYFLVSSQSHRYKVKVSIVCLDFLKLIELIKWILFSIIEREREKKNRLWFSIYLSMAEIFSLLFQRPPEQIFINQPVNPKIIYQSNHTKKTIKEKYSNRKIISNFLIDLSTTKWMNEWMNDKII